MMRLAALCLLAAPAVAVLSTPSDIDFVISDCDDVTPALIERLLASNMARMHKTHRVFLYQKCGTGKWLRSVAHQRAVHGSQFQFGWPTWLHTISLPNYGFEAHTYLYHIATHYDDVANVTVFLKDDMTRHGEALFATSSHVNFSLPLTWLVTDATSAADSNDTYGGSVTDNLPATLAFVDAEKRRVGGSACSAVYDIQDLLREFWPQFNVNFKTCFHPPQGAQFALRREAIKIHPRGLFERAIEVMSPGAYGGLEAYISHVNAQGGICTGLAHEGELEDDEPPTDDDGVDDDDTDDDDAAGERRRRRRMATAPAPAPPAAPLSVGSLPNEVWGKRGKKLALGLPVISRDLSFTRAKSNKTHIEASYYTAVLLANAWQFLFTRDGCVRDWQAAMPLRAHCAKLRRQASGACTRNSAYHRECGCELSDEEQTEHQKEVDEKSQALDEETNRKDEALDSDDAPKPWGFGLLGFQRQQ